MTILSNSPFRPAFGEATSAKRYVAHLGTSMLPKPNEADAARMNLSLRVNFM